MHLSDLAVRLIGPFLFSAAFIIFINNYNLMEDYVNGVKAKFVEGEVYREGESLTADEAEYFDFTNEDGYSVSGKYLVSILSEDITIKTIVDSKNNNLPYRRLVIDPNGLSTGPIYTLFVKDNALGAINQVKVDKSGPWISGESVNLNKVISTSSNYQMTVQYAATGKIESITYTEV